MKRMKKKKITGVILIIGFCVLLCFGLLIGNLNLSNLTGFAAKDRVELCDNTKIYLSATSKISYKGSGTYYIWADDVTNNRMQITKKEKYVGKKIWRAGWVDVNSLSACSSKTTVYESGDVNKDGKVTATDALLILQHNAGLKELTGDNFKYADVNGDGKVTTTDARLVLRKVAGLGIDSDTGDGEEIGEISMTKHDKNWVVGDTKTVTVTLPTSNDTFTVTSSNPDVMSYSNETATSFKLTAKSDGISKITVTSTKTGKSDSYEYTVVKKTYDDSAAYNIDIKFEGTLSSNAVYMYDSEGDKKVDVTLNNNTGETKYYRWFLYHGKLDNSGLVVTNGDPYHVRDCNSYNKTTTVTSKSKLAAKEPLKVMVARSYSTKSECEADTFGQSKTYVVEKRANYGLKSSFVTITMSPEGSTGGSGIYYVSTEKSYKTNVTFKNYTKQTLYYRWFTYNSHDTSTDKALHYKDKVCYPLTSSNATVHWNIGMSLNNSKRAGKVKVYSSKKSCEDDDTSTSTSNVISSKSVKYELSRTYTSGGFKMIRYDHEGLSKDVGTQMQGWCNLAAAAYGAYILSGGKWVVPVNNAGIATMGGAPYDYASDEVSDMWNKIVEKINAGIPVSLRVVAKQKKGEGEHWVTVIGYKTNTNTGNLDKYNIRESLYIIDPVDPDYAEKYDSKINGYNITLWKGIGSNRPNSFKRLHMINGEFRLSTWASYSSLNTALCKPNNPETQYMEDKNAKRCSDCCK